MHDCFGKRIKPFDRVRAATKEELEAQAHPEASYPTSLSPAEQTVLPAYVGTDTCNVVVVPEVVVRFDGADASGHALRFVTPGPTSTCTARALVKLDD